MSRAGLALGVVSVAVLVWAGAAGAVTRLPGFRSPSGNIACFVVPGPPSTLLCSIERATYAPKLQDRCMQPGGAGVDWHGFTLVATKKGAVSCSGGILYDPSTQRPGYVTLVYGRSWRRGPFTCSSRLTGITCRSRLGHGLFLSRVAWRTW